MTEAVLNINDVNILDAIATTVVYMESQVTPVPDPVPLPNKDLLLNLTLLNRLHF